MNAPLSRLSADLSMAADRRREPRYAAACEMTIRSMSGSTTTADLIDMSRHGACIKSEADWLRPGRFVAIGIGQGDMLEAVIRWTRDGSVGMEFLHPVPSDREDWHALMDCGGY
ncbi:hypothetical protein B2G71_20440 [Novosphingobium sp. PC22D]|uniref:PilZ domain-containing protein n=1 Tax=Novosphingobium sp. PC22D TaxID=1962403 RepID=UPI000BFB0EAC|nr:PilZ domain-containing protein [Novosphingobium sp. PC22D]PEQ10832.1 hypothetical protein B2G71_20440 [Novosphingobium sp. PC22D]